MTFSDADLELLDFDAILKNSPPRCDEYSDAFRNAKNLAINLGLSPGTIEALEVLSQIFGFHFSSEDASEPFSASVIFRGKRSAVPDDYTNEHLQTLLQLTTRYKQPEFCARLNDVAWIVLRDISAGRRAIANYMSSAIDLFDVHDWPDYWERIERATRIAVQLGDKAAQQEIFQKIDQTIREIFKTDDLFLTSRLLGLMAEFCEGNFAELGKIAEAVGDRAVDQNDYSRAREYFETAVALHACNKNTAEQRRCRMKAAETFLLEARAVDSHIVAAWHLQSAIQAYRGIGGERQRIADIYEEMREHQKLQIEEMKPISVEVPLDDLPSKAAQTVSGKDFPQAIFSLGFLCPLPSREKLDRNAREHMESFPASFLFTSVFSDGDGKVLSRRPSMLGDQKEYEAAKLHRMIEHCQQMQSFYAVSVIAPAAERLRLEHRLSLRKFLNLTSSSPFVPFGREDIFARGLLAGLQGDLVSSTHFLVPQLEHAFRVQFEQNGITTSRIDQYGIQQDIDLNEILRSAEIGEIYSADIVFNLRVLFVEKAGFNLRNRLAHGQLSDRALGNPTWNISWWIVLRLCLLPLVSAGREDQPQASTG